VSKAQRDKGARGEREAVKYFRALGLAAHRVPGSGAFSGLPSDVRVTLPDLGRGHDEQWLVECKVGRQVPKTVLKWLAGNHLLYMRTDGGLATVVLGAGTFARLLLALLAKQGSDE